ncbi:MAG: hypothetical protein Q9164_007207 [Protoblastenia rupestris]
MRKEQPSNEPIILKLAKTSDSRQIIAVTGEDKSIHVFRFSEDGNLSHFSARAMPKRPCAIALSPDESTIICGDKFGDVYAIPLFGKSAPQEGVIGSEPVQKLHPVPKPFTSTANTKTVHSKRNLKALENQEKMTSIKKDKEVPPFDHRLLLGHVSLLTDVISTSLSASVSPSGRSRSYILTADRDEHIRISRGMPQAHIIEGYCLGHKNFISRLCIPEGHERLLVSGGGDDHIYLWNWISQNLLLSLDLKTIVHELRNAQLNVDRANVDVLAINKKANSDSNTTDNIAVSGIWTCRIESQETQIFRACALRNVNDQ